MQSECCQTEIEMNKSGFHGWCTGCQSIIVFDRKGEVRKLEFAEKEPEKESIQQSLFEF